MPYKLCRYTFMKLMTSVKKWRPQIWIQLYGGSESFSRRDSALKNSPTLQLYLSFTHWLFKWLFHLDRYTADAHRQRHTVCVGSHLDDDTFVIADVQCPDTFRHRQAGSGLTIAAGKVGNIF